MLSFLIKKFKLQIMSKYQARTQSRGYKMRVKKNDESKGRNVKMRCEKTSWTKIKIKMKQELLPLTFIFVLCLSPQEAKRPTLLWS